MGDGGGGHWLVRMEWRPSGWSVCVPLLIFPCTTKSRSFSSGTGSPGWSRNKGRKTVVVVYMGVRKVSKQIKQPSRSLKVTAVGAIQYDFLLVFHCNYLSILYHFVDIISYFPKFKEVT